MIPVTILSESEACRVKQAEPYMHIAIRNPGDPYPALSEDPNRKAVLHIAFDDGEPDSCSSPISASDADQIADFFLDNLELPGLVINCKAGLSRSPGVASGIAYFLMSNEDFRRPPYFPNMYVHRMVARGLKRRLAERADARAR